MSDKFNSLDTHKYVSIVYFSFCSISYNDPSLTGIFFFFFFGSARSYLQHTGSGSLTRDQIWAP